MIRKIISQEYVGVYCVLLYYSVLMDARDDTLASGVNIT